jgi:hypothetical protein
LGGRAETTEYLQQADGTGQDFLEKAKFDDALESLLILQA